MPDECVIVHCDISCKAHVFLLPPEPLPQAFQGGPQYISLSLERVFGSTEDVPGICLICSCFIPGIYKKNSYIIFCIQLTHT